MIFKKIDIIGGNIGFNYEKLNFNSILGGVFSIFLLSCMTLLVFGFGRDFYKRINPSFIRQTVFPEKAPLYRVNNKNFSLAFRFEDNDGSLLNNTRAFYIQTEYITNIRNEKGDYFDSKSQLLYMTYCTEDLFFNKENFENGAFNSWLCPVMDNILFGGSYAGDFASTIKINFFYCPEGEINPNTKESCVSKKELQNISKNLVYMDIAGQLPFVTPGDYENGLKPKILYNWYALDFNYHKIVFTYFSNYTMISDYGWILEDNKVESFLMMNKQILDFINMDFFKEKNKLGSFWIFSDTDNGTELFKRKYAKIQLLLAEIGGFMNFIFTIGGILIHNYNNHQYYNKLFAYLYPDQINDCNHFLSSDKMIKNNADIIQQNTSSIPQHNIRLKSKQNVNEVVSKKEEFKNEEKSIGKLINNYTSNNEDIKKIRNIEYFSKISSSDINDMHNNELNKEEFLSTSKESNEILALKIELRPEIEVLKTLKKNINENNSIINFYSSKSNNESYQSQIDENTNNLITYNILNTFCACSKKFTRKNLFLILLKEKIMDKMDIRNYLKIQFELDMIKKSIFINNSSNINNDLEKEEDKYLKFIKQFDLNFEF